MFSVSFTAGSCAVLIGWLLYRSLNCTIKKSFSIKHEALQLLMLVNLLVIYRMTFHPFEKLDGQVQPLLFDSAAAWPFWINLTPFVNLLDYEAKREMLLNVIGNSTMFIPTGIMTPLIYKRKFPGTILTGFLLSLVIEIIQLPFSTRCSDVDDLILNTLGCLVGYGIYALVKAICKKK